jgi:hypothetical protein
VQTPSTPAATKQTGSKYVPPSMRDGANKGRGETMKSSRGNFIFADFFFRCFIML